MDFTVKRLFLILLVTLYFLSFGKGAILRKTRNGSYYGYENIVEGLPVTTCVSSTGEKGICKALSKCHRIMRLNHTASSTICFRQGITVPFVCCAAKEKEHNSKEYFSKNSDKSVAFQELETKPLLFQKKFKQLDSGSLREKRKEKSDAKHSSELIRSSSVVERSRKRRDYIDKIMGVIAHNSRKKTEKKSRSFHYFSKDVNPQSLKKRMHKRKRNPNSPKNRGHKHLTLMSPWNFKRNGKIRRKDDDSKTSIMSVHKANKKDRKTREAQTALNDAGISDVGEENPKAEVKDSPNDTEEILSTTILPLVETNEEKAKGPSQAPSVSTTQKPFVNETVTTQMPKDIAVEGDMTMDESFLPDEPTEMLSVKKIEELPETKLPESDEQKNKTEEQMDSADSVSIKQTSESGLENGGKENNESRAEEEKSKSEMGNDITSKVPTELSVTDGVNIHNKENPTEMTAKNETLIIKISEDSKNSSESISGPNTENKQNERAGNEVTNNEEPMPSPENEVQQSEQIGSTNNEEQSGNTTSEQEKKVNSNDERISNNSDHHESKVDAMEIVPEIEQSTNKTLELSQNQTETDILKNETENVGSDSLKSENKTTGETVKDIEIEASISESNHNISNNNGSVPHVEESSIIKEDTEQNGDKTNSIASPSASTEEGNSSNINDNETMTSVFSETPKEIEDGLTAQPEVRIDVLGDMNVSDIQHQSKNESMSPDLSESIAVTTKSPLAEQTFESNNVTDKIPDDLDKDIRDTQITEGKIASEDLIPASKALNVSDAILDPDDGLPIPKLPDPLIQEEAVVIIPTISEEHEIKQNFKMSDSHDLINDEEDRNITSSIPGEVDLPEREISGRSLEARNVLNIETAEVKDAEEVLHQNPKLLPEILFPNFGPFLEQHHNDTDDVAFRKSPPYKGGFRDPETVEEFTLSKNPENFEAEQQDTSRDLDEDVEVLSSQHLSELLHRIPSTKNMSDMDTSLEIAEIINTPVFQEYSPVFAATNQQQSFASHLPFSDRGFPPQEEGKVHFPNSGGTNVPPARSQHPISPGYHSVPVVDPSRYPTQAPHPSQYPVHTSYPSQYPVYTSHPSQYPATAVDYNYPSYNRQPASVPFERIQESSDLWGQSSIDSESKQGLPIETFVPLLQSRPSKPSETNRPLESFNPKLANIISSICGIRRNVRARREGFILPGDIDDEKETLSAGSLYGGTDAKLGNWPWMAAIMIRNPRSNKLELLCGGTIVGVRHILTSAHCFQSGRKLSDHTILLGEYDLNSETDGATVVEYEILDVLFHPSFFPPKYYNDVAIIKLSEPIIFMDTIVPICLPEANTYLTENMPVTVAGWGRSYFEGKPSEILQEISIRVLPKSICETSYRQLSNFNLSLPNGLSDFICAGIPDGSKDSCLGDSGGPLMTLDASHRWTVNGIVSFGYKCGLKDYPGLYLDISKQLPWIKAQLLE